MPSGSQQGERLAAQRMVQQRSLPLRSTGIKETLKTAQTLEWTAAHLHLRRWSGSTRGTGSWSPGRSPSRQPAKSRHLRIGLRSYDDRRAGSCSHFRRAACILVSMPYDEYEKERGCGGLPGVSASAIGGGARQKISCSTWTVGRSVDGSGGFH